MKLYQVFESGSIHPIHKDKACIVTRITTITPKTTTTTLDNESNIENNNNDNNNNNNNNTLILLLNKCEIIQKELSYYNIQQYVLVLHQKWIIQQIKQLIYHNTSSNNTCNEYHEIVISYLCYNDCDYFISLIACTTFVYSYFNINNNTNTNTKIIVVPPILLNTRWTHTEIVSIVTPSKNNQSKSIIQQPTVNENKNHYTLLLYDERTKNLATAVQTELSNKTMKSSTTNNNSINNDCHHIINCQQVPNFSTKYMTITKKTIQTTTSTDTTGNDKTTSSSVSQSSNTTTNSNNNTSTRTNSFQDDVLIHNNNQAIIFPVNCIECKQSTASALRKNEASIKLTKNNSSHSDINSYYNMLNNEDISNSIITNTNNTDNTDNTPAIIVLTSGTSSSLPKGVLLSHKSILLQSYAKLYSSPCNYNSTSILYGVTVSFFHIGGLSSIIAIILAHGTIVLPEINTNTNTNTNTNIGFDTKTLIEFISIQSTNIKDQSYKSNQEQHHAAKKLMLLSSHMPPTTKTESILYVPNTLIVVPAMLHSIQEFLLLEQQTQQSQKKQHQQPQQFPIVQLILVGGQSLSKNLYKFISYTFPNATIIQTYACTEASSSLTFLPIIHPNRIDKILTIKTKSITNNTRKVDTILESQSNHLSQQQQQQQQQKLSGDCVGTPPSHIDIVLLRYEQQQEIENKDTRTNDNPNRFRLSIDTKDIISTPYTVGIIATRGSHVMNGYWSRSYDSRYRSISSIHQQQPNVWYVTNDLGYWDNNHNLYFYGRCTDTIRTGGETVQANEVEKVIQQHYMVKECSVFPIKDDSSKFGELVACAIVLVDSNSSNSNDNKELEQINTTFLNQPSQQSFIQSVQFPQQVTLSTIKEWCTKKGLAKYKHPKYIFVLKQLPRNSSGKVIKYHLTEIFTQIVKVQQQNQRQRKLTSTSKL